MLKEKLAYYEKNQDTYNSLEMVKKLADFYYANDQYEQAWPLYQRFVANNTDGLDEIAERYTAHDQYQLLEELYERKLAGTSATASDLAALARLYQKRGQTYQALERARQASWFISIRSEGQRGHIWFHLSLLDALQPKDYLSKTAYSMEAFELGQLYHSDSVGTALAQMAARFAKGSTVAKLIRDREELSKELKSIQISLLTVMDKTCGTQCWMVYTRSQEEIDLRVRLNELFEQKSKMDQQLQQEIPAYEELVSTEPITLLKTQKLLAEDEAMLVFVFGDNTSGNITTKDQAKDHTQDNDHGYVWLLTDDGQSMRRLPFGKQKLQERVAALRQSLSPDSNPNMAAYPVAAAYDLYKDIMGSEAQAWYMSDVRTLFIVADGALEQLPFAVLVTEPPKDNLQNYQNVAWLARRWATVTLPTVSSLRALRVVAAASDAKKPFIGFGDPNFSGMDSSQRGVGIRLTRNVGNTELADPQLLRDMLVSLPETADELRTVAKTLGAGEDALFLKDQATVPKVTTTPLSEYKVVYFATHALVAGQMEDFKLGGVEPAIALTPPAVATPENDGLLRASQVAQLKLNADWVVLSACNTAAADANSAIGLSGLAKAFFYAGARALLVSHWSVLSKPAVALTTQMFREWQLNPGIGRAEALRGAQMAVLDHPADPSYSHPQAWAPFVVAGEGGVGR